MRIKRSRFVAAALALTLLVSTAMPITAFAAESGDGMRDHYVGPNEHGEDCLRKLEDGSVVNVQAYFGFNDEGEALGHDSSCFIRTDQAYDPGDVGSAEPEEDEYTVVYLVNGTAQSYNGLHAGDSVPAYNNGGAGPEYAGYTFLGWKLYGSGGSGAPESVNPDDADEDGNIVLVAQWAPADAQDVVLDDGAQLAAPISEDPGSTDTQGVRDDGLYGTNVTFEVQYYAWLEVMATGDTNGLETIDTSGKNLPVNKGNVDADPTGNGFKYLSVGADGRVGTAKELMPIYAGASYDYYKAPTINYFDKMVENQNYEIAELWVLNENGDKTSVDRDSGDWTVHGMECSGGEYLLDGKPLHFTNRDLSGIDGLDLDGYIMMEEGAVIRLVYEQTKNEVSDDGSGGVEIGAAFYDYDISNGWVYRDRPPYDQKQYQHLDAGTVFSGTSLTNGILEWLGSKAIRTEPDGQSAFVLDENGDKIPLTEPYRHIYAYTNAQGINSSGNYSGSGTKLAFGNVNTGTGLSKLTWYNNGQDNELNKYNNKGYGGCTFGLVTGLSDGKIQYASGIQVPALFNDGSATGKTSYDDGQYSLRFNRVGDTYTLSAVNGTSAVNLTNFSHPTNSAGTHDGSMDPKDVIWTNNFWPMDSAPSFGTGTHDVKFGGTATFKGKDHEIRFGPYTERFPDGFPDYTFPESDDGLYHNSYFGMTTKVGFKLTADYLGPLEYYFYGDDDMWVFLTNTGTMESELVCDIGGVHSSVGEYVNLRDYLPEGSSGEYELSVFYTERGASGSTCWIQFTLPSVSSATIEKNKDEYAELLVSKAVDGKPVMDGDYEFELFLYDGNDDWLADDYAYVIVDKDGNETGDYGLAVHHGSVFRLADGEAILIKYLPDGTKYKVVETEWRGATDTSHNVDGTGTEAGREASGAVSAGNTGTVAFVNVYMSDLPATGGPGTALLALCGTLGLLAGMAVLMASRKKRA